jgi:hypothetical protein
MKILENINNVKEFNELYDAVGWGAYDDEVSEIALKNTIYSVSIYEDDKITQLVPRVYVTDKARIFTDVNVDPEKGIAEDQFWEGFTYDNRGEGWAGSTGTKAK